MNALLPIRWAMLWAAALLLAACTACLPAGPTGAPGPAVTASRSAPTAAGPIAVEPTAVEPTAAEPTAVEPTAADPAFADPADADPTPGLARSPRTCVDDLALVLWLDPDKANPTLAPVLPAGLGQRAGWRVRNTGSCTWDSAYFLQPAAGGAPQPLPRPVRPGDTIDLFVAYTTPQQPGPLTLAWDLRDGGGRLVGPPLTLSLQSADLPLPTLAPDPLIAAYPASIYLGQSATLSWQARQAVAAYLYPLGQPWQRHPVALQGDLVVAPERTTTYELRLVRGDGSVQTYRQQVEVDRREPPQIVFLHAEADDFDEDEVPCVTLEWSIIGQVSQVLLFRDALLIGEGLDKLGVHRDCPSAAARYLYTLTAIGLDENDELSCALDVGFTGEESRLWLAAQLWFSRPLRQCPDLGG
ncbi:MAG: NBR1-Ig-like domain-containing protein [Chloroflexota bacterium]